jgi:hypothetical protein
MESLTKKMKDIGIKVIKPKNKKKKITTVKAAKKRYKIGTNNFIARKLGSRQIKKFSRVIPKTTKVCSEYYNALINPERALAPKVPGQFLTATCTLKRHITVSVTANAGGKICVLWQPFNLFDDANALSGLGVQNNVSYDGATNFTGGLLAQTVKFGVPASNVLDYRLVSASIVLQPQVSINTAQGKFGGASIPFAAANAAVGSQVTASTAVQTFSNIENYSFYAEADVCQFESLRCIYTPLDVHDLELYPINSGALPNTNEEATFIGFGTGLPASCPINIELYYNFEVTPASGSILVGSDSMNADFESAQTTVGLVKLNPSLICMPTKSGTHNKVIQPIQVADTNVKVDNPIGKVFNYMPATWLDRGVNENELHRRGQHGGHADDIGWMGSVSIPFNGYDYNFQNM